MDRYVGKRLDGRYEIQEIIGVGGMAVVYKAYDNQENRIVAIKILKEEFVSNQEFVRRFKNESKAIAMLSHQNIVKVYDVSFGDLIQYIVMEYIEGITLKEFIERQGSLRWKDAVHFTIQILRGLQHAHDKGIVHRDVKPQNIMVLPDGTIKVTDFGIARFARSDQRTITDKAIGSVHYISPEQARGEKTDEKSDIYSVGVMLYEMITGQMPFQAESAVSVAIMQLQRDPKRPSEINGAIPLGLEQITMHAMQKSPERRYQSAAEMLCDIDAFRKDPAVTFDYNYFVDDSPTKFVGDISDKESEPLEQEEEAKEKSGLIPILTGVAVAFVLALVVLGIIFVPKFLGGKTEEIACPKFVGLNYEEDIKDNEEYKKFNFSITYKTDEKPADEVISQSEKEGEKLKEGALIKLTVSAGSNAIAVPNVSGEAELSAKAILEEKGLKVRIETQTSEDYEAGFVIRTEPVAKTEVAEGTEITVFVSSGKPESKAKIPDVISMKKADAEEKLQEEGFIVNVDEITLTAEDKYYPVGLVVKQSPEASDKEYAEGETVTIYLCKGYKFDIKTALPTDFAKTFNVSLWEDGTQVDKGSTVDDSAEYYTFKNLTTQKDKVEYVVKVSLSGETDFYNLCKITYNVKDGSSTVDQSISDYPSITATEPIVSSQAEITSQAESQPESETSSEANVSSQLTSEETTSSEDTSSQAETEATAPDSSAAEAEQSEDGEDED